MRRLKLVLLALVGLLSVEFANAQRVIAYHQGAFNGDIQSWYWSKVTDINYSFLQVHTDGSVALHVQGADSWTQASELNNFNDLKLLASNNSKRVTISVGGASPVQKANFKSNVSTVGKAQTLANNIVAFANAHSLNGIDIDWEAETDTDPDKPTSAEWIRLASALQTAIAASSNPNLELSAAVFPWEYNNQYVTPACHSYFDHFNLMVYDFGGPDWDHHSLTVPTNSWTNGQKYRGWDVEAASVDYWNTVMGLDKTKMVLGLPFYGRSANWGYSQSDYKSYRQLLALGASSTSDSYSTWRYNGQTTIQKKTTFAITNGLKGVMYWEWTGDATSEAVSLQKGIDDAITAVGCSSPNLGGDQSMCGQSSIILDANLAETDFTFKWFKDGVQQSGTSRTFTASAAGVYKIEASSKTVACTRESNVTLSGSMDPLPTLEDVSLCGGSSDVDATIVGFESMDYVWKNGSGTTISSSATASISVAGTYTVTVTDPAGQCSPQSDAILAAETTIDIVHDTVCTAGEEAHITINNPSGAYGWYTAETGGSLLGNDAELFQNINTTPSTFWVQKTGGAINYTVGLNYDHAVPTETWNGPPGCDDGSAGGDYECWWNNTTSTCDLDDTRLYFTTYQDVTITSFKARIDHSGATDVNIYDGTGNILFTESVDIAFVGEQVVNVNFALTPGNYYIGMPNAKQWAGKMCMNPDWTPASTYDYSVMGVDGVIKFNTTVSSSAGGFSQAIDHWYAGFYDIVISTGQPCPRVPAYGIIDNTIPECAAANVDPVATITASKTSALVGEVITLTYGGTDSDGTIQSTVITMGGATQSGWTSPYAWTAVLGSHVFEVTVTDDDGATHKASVTVNVTAAPNVDPVATITASKTSALVGEVITLTYGGTDSDGTIQSTVITMGGATQSGWTSPYAWTAVLGSHVFEVTVTDNDGATHKASVTVNVTGPDNEASITIISPIDGERMGDDPYLIQVNATDADGLASVKVKIVNPLLSFPFNESILTLDDDGSGNYSKVWGASINGDFTMTIITTDVNGGTTESNPITITVDSNFGVGIDDDLDLSKLSMVVYPNPTTGDANVDFNIRNAGSGTLTILDMSGNVIDVVSEGGFGLGVQTAYLRTNDLAVGIYILRLNVDGEVVITKFVKE